MQTFLKDPKQHNLVPSTDLSRVLLRLALKTKFDKIPLFPEIVFHEIHGFTCQGKSFRNA
jgi:hypothetical protein